LKKDLGLGLIDCEDSLWETTNIKHPCLQFNLNLDLGLGLRDLGDSLKDIIKIKLLFLKFSYN